MGFEQLQVGWTQLRTLRITADSPATPIVIPGILGFRKYILIIPDADDVELVTAAGQSVSTMLTSSTKTKIFGVFESAVQLYAYAAAPTDIIITPFGDENGELDELPYFIAQEVDTSDFVTWTYYETAEASFAVDHSNDLGAYRVQNLAQTGSYNFTFHVPFDFSSLVSVSVAFFSSAGASGSGKDIDLESMYAGDGEIYNINNETDTTTTYTLPAAGVLGTIDASGVFSNLEASDCCGLTVTHNGIGGALSYTGVVMRYLRVVP